MRKFHAPALLVVYVIFSTATNYNRATDSGFMWPTNDGYAVMLPSPVVCYTDAFLPLYSCLVCWLTLKSYASVFERRYVCGGYVCVYGNNSTASQAPSAAQASNSKNGPQSCCCCCKDCKNSTRRSGADADADAGCIHTVTYIKHGHGAVLLDAACYRLLWRGAPIRFIARD